jgi:hypothetical protein
LKQGPQTHSRHDALHFGFAYWAREPALQVRLRYKQNKDLPQFVSTQVINAPELAAVLAGVDLLMTAISARKQVAYPAGPVEMALARFA